MKTGPVSPPAPSQVPAGAFRPRSVPNRVLQKQAPAGSIRDHRSKLQPIPSDVHEASPASVRRTSSRRTGDHPANVSPASRRPFVGRLSGKPATFPRTSFRQAGDCPLRLFSTGRTRLPDRPFLSRRTLRVPSGLPSSKLSGRPFAVPSPEGDGSAGLRKSGFGLGFPRRLALLPGCPTRALLISFPKDLDQLGTGGVSEVHAVSGRSSLTAKSQDAVPARFGQAESEPSSLWITRITWISPLPDCS